MSRIVMCKDCGDHTVDSSAKCLNCNGTKFHTLTENEMVYGYDKNKYLFIPTDKPLMAWECKR